MSNLISEAMNSLISNELVGLLSRAALDPDNRPDDLKLRDAYASFLELLYGLCRSKASTAELLRTLGQARCDFTVLHRCFDRDTSLFYYSYKALESIRCELDILRMKIEYPAMFADERNLPRSPLRLSPEFTSMDMIEIISALYELTVFRMPDGSPAHLNKLLRVFEIGFNISISNFDVMRNKMLNRSRKLTHFLDLLRGALIERSQR